MGFVDEWLPWLGRVLQVVVGIGLVIFVHELGHFLLAKWAGVRVETFSLGFGPRLLGFRRRETDYRLSLVPLGGYVKMAGESPDSPRSGASDEFLSKPVGARAAVIAAGVVMNAVFAVFSFLVAFKVGVQMVPPVVGSVLPGSPAEAAGLQRGDEIVAVAGERPLDFLDVSLWSALSGEGGVELTIRREGSVLPPIRVKPRKELGQEVQRLGIEPIEALSFVEPSGPAAIAGLEPGDRILGIDGRPLSSQAEFVEAIYSHPGQPLALRLWRRGDLLTVSVTPEARPRRSFGIELADVPTVCDVQRRSPAAAAGLRPGDVLVSLEGERVTAATVGERLRAAQAGKPIALVIERDGERIDLALTPASDPGSGRSVVGASFDQAVVGRVVPGSPAAAAGLEPGARLVALNGRRVLFLPGPLETLASKLGEDRARLAWIAPGGEERSAELTGAEIPGLAFGWIGIAAAPAEFSHRVSGVIAPVLLGFERTWIFMEHVLLTFRGMIERRIEPTALAGPIMIGKGAYDVAARGSGTLLYFLAIISVNLAVLNLLPIPILDGGHLLFLAIEKVKGAPVSPGLQAAAQWVGLALLLALMVFVTRNDIARLLGS